MGIHAWPWWVYFIAIRLCGRRGDRIARPGSQSRRCSREWSRTRGRARNVVIPMGSRDYNRSRVAEDIKVLGAILEVKYPAPLERGIFI
jgi:hypothetical protein